jgi:hypothetical protein
MRILIFLILFLISWQTNSQIHFYKLFSGTGYDRAEGIAQLEDSSYLITGSSSSWSENSDVFLLHLDSLGNYLWSKNYGGQEADGGKRVMYNADLGVFIAGYSNSYNSSGDYNAFLLKTDLEGNEQWIKTYGDSGFWERVNDATMTLDSGIVMVGESLNKSNDNSDIYMVRTNRNGDTLWTKKIGGEGKDVANSIIKVNNNYLIGGQFFVPDSNMTKGFVMEINDNGDVLRFDTISDLGGNYYVSDLSLGINKYYVIGYRETIGDNDDYYGIFDLNGGLISQYTFVYPGYNSQLNQLAYVSALDRVAIGYQSLNPGTNQDAFDVSMAYFFAQNLNYIAPFWSMAISNYGEDKINDLIQTSDGSFITVGYNSLVDDGIIQPNGGSNLFVAKIGPDDVFPNAFGAQINQLVGNAELSEKQALLVYPNPFLDKIIIHTSNIQSQHISVFNQIGQCVLQQTISGPTQLDVSSISEGIYYLQIGDKTIQLIKQ